MRRFVLIVLLTVSACAAASAAQDGQHWEALGPWYTDTRIVAVGPGPNGPVFESAGGSVMWSEDGGRTWSRYGMPPKESVSVYGFVPDDAVPGALFITTYHGVFHSPGAGKTWEAFGDQTPLGSVGCLAAEPPDTHTAYAGCGVGRPAAGRIFVTRDSGRTWEQLRPDLDTSYIGDLLVRPGGEAALYVATGKGVQRLALPELGVGR